MLFCCCRRIQFQISLLSAGQWSPKTCAPGSRKHSLLQNCAPGNGFAVRDVPRMGRAMSYVANAHLSVFVRQLTLFTCLLALVNVGTNPMVVVLRWLQLCALNLCTPRSLARPKYFKAMEQPHEAPWSAPDCHGRQLSPLL